MATAFVTGKTKVWTTLTDHARSFAGKSFVAVAYFSKGAASMLPLRKGSILVVDASEGVVKAGQTCPEELAKLYKLGVRIFTYTGLHAKVYVFGKTVFVGSANVSGHSANYLEEAVLASNEKAILDESTNFIKALCSKELGLDSITELQKIYRPPHFLHQFKTTKGSQKQELNQPKVYVVKLVPLKRYDTSSLAYKIGRKAAERLVKNKNRHIVEDYKHSINARPRPGDVVIRVTHDEGNVTVAAPATVLNIKRLPGTKRAFVYVEAREVAEKELDKIAHRFPDFDLLKGGLKHSRLAAELNLLWK